MFLGVLSSKIKLKLGPCCTDPGQNRPCLYSSVQREEAPPGQEYALFSLVCQHLLNESIAFYHPMFYVCNLLSSSTNYVLSVIHCLWTVL